MQKTLIIKAGREKSLLRRHQWIFSGAVKNTKGDPQSGDVVRAVAEDGRFLGLAAYSAKSQIVARVLSFDESTVIDGAFYRARIAAAVARRAALAKTADAMRLVHAESDGLPGLVADRYGNVVVMQLLTAGIDPQRELIAKLFMELPGVTSVHERSDADVRELEGLPPVSGHVAGEALEGPVTIRENDLHIDVDIAHGHKTGFYLDQRDNRALVQSLSKDAAVLNCFCYTGTMSLAALKGGARSVLSIDSSAPSMALGAAMMAKNGLDAARAEWMDADVFAALRKLRDQGRTFDLIILDPPKFAPTAHHAEKAARAYKDINLLGFKLLSPGGHLMTYSCSGGVSADLFQKIVAGAALDAKVDAQIVKRLGAGIDHPVAVHFPEGDYLKGLVLRRMD
ncbi:MAG: class I SAM-dependent rRNA methyltransferase [Betaproteobacteria bacterium]|nr:class I SAM-dependent rRNA methyltransferase [Betaproteobacteria bacterium]